MFNTEIFKNRIKELQSGMKISLRNKLNKNIEAKIIDELSDIFITMVNKYTDAVRSDISIPAIQRVAQYPEEDRVPLALLELIDKMEADFSHKFSMDLKHDLEKDIEVGKIKIAFLDGVRRSLNISRQS